MGAERPNPQDPLDDRARKRARRPAGKTPETRPGAGKGRTPNPLIFPPREEFPGSEVLAANSPSEVLDRLTVGDPLDLEARCDRRLRQRAYLIDTDRVCQRTAARVALASMGYSGTPPLGEWLDERIDALRRMEV